MFREPSSPASMRMWLRSLCHSSVGASASRLTSTGLFLADLANDEVDESSRNDDLLDDRLAVEMPLDVLAGPGQLQEPLLRRIALHLDPIAELAVHLHDQHVGLPLQQIRIRLGPWLLPDPLTGQPLEDLCAEVWREREEQRGGRRGRESDDRGPGRAVIEGVLEAIDLVDQLHHCGDRGVELEARLDVPGGLVDRPVSLCEQLAGRAIGTVHGSARVGPLRSLAPETPEPGEQ